MNMCLAVITKTCKHKLIRVKLWAAGHGMTSQWNPRNRPYASTLYLLQPWCRGTVLTTKYLTTFAESYISTANVTNYFEPQWTCNDKTIDYTKENLGSFTVHVLRQLTWFKTLHSVCTINNYKKSHTPLYELTEMYSTLPIKYK